jgi:serine/threonine-protein kinase
MGTIYLADDPVIGREVAVKVITIRPDMGVEQERQYRERFLREARAAGALVHPNIVAVHDIGQDPTVGCPYIVMEYVPGWDLRKVIESRAPLPPRTVLKIGLRIAGALDYAHRNGIVHRDVKPANVLIGDRAEVKITDFGVARLAGSDLTRSDDFVGSPAYMAPEQLSGGRVDGRADLFALGVILYQLLTGRLPFNGETLSELMFRIATEPAPPPSTVQRGLSPVFDPILERALAKEPAKRFQTGEELMQALLSLDLGKERRAPRVARASRARRAARVRRADPARPATTMWDLHSPRRLVGAAALFVLILALLAGGAHLLGRGAFRPLRADPGAATAAEPPAATPGPSGDDRPGAVQAAESRARTALDRLIPRPAATLEVRLTGKVPAGHRLSLRIDDGTMGAATLATAIEGDPTAQVRRLAVPAGRRVIAVTLLGADGKVRAGKSIEETMPEAGVATLHIGLPRSGKRLDLTWIAPGAPAGSPGQH